MGMKESKDFAVLIQQKRVGIKLNEKWPYAAHRAKVRSKVVMSCHAMIFPDELMICHYMYMIRHDMSQYVVILDMYVCMS